MNRRTQQQESGNENPDWLRLKRAAWWLVPLILVLAFLIWSNQ